MQVIQVRQRKQQPDCTVIQGSYVIHNRASLSRLSKQESAGRLIVRDPVARLHTTGLFQSHHRVQPKPSRSVLPNGARLSNEIPRDRPSR